MTTIVLTGTILAASSWLLGVCVEVAQQTPRAYRREIAQGCRDRRG